MGLNIYFFNKRGDDVEYLDALGITHNLNKIVDECYRHRDAFVYCRR